MPTIGAMEPMPLVSLRRSALRLATLALVLFHGQLLWKRWTDGSWDDLGVVARWLASALLVLGLVWLRRQRGSLFRGREAGILWILVALLHATAGIPAPQMLAAPAPWLVLPLGLVAAQTLALALGRKIRPCAPSAQRRRIAGPAVLVLATGQVDVPGCRAPPC